MFTKEMMDALEADGEKLRQLTGEDHGPVFLHITPKADACDHDFTGWSNFEDGNGGEQVCAKCGMGAMAYTLSFDF